MIKTKFTTPIEIEVSKEAKKESKLIGQLRPHKGHTIYEFNYVSKALSEALFTKTDIEYNPNPKKQKKRKTIITNKDCIYFSALNLKSAERKIRKNFREH